MSANLYNHVVVRRNRKVDIHLYGRLHTSEGNRMTYVLVHNGDVVEEFASGKRNNAIARYKKLVEQYNT